MSIDRYSNGSEAGNNFKKEVRLRSLMRFLAHVVLDRAVSVTS
jgi:hypothetical protein